MEQQIADLTKTGGMLGTVDVEIFYWWCTAIMVCIHAGFLAYEMGASRAKNVLASGVKNILAFAFIVPTFFFFGWWIYLTFPNGFIPSADGNVGLPWAPEMGPNLADNASGVFWAAFVLFAATTASIFSGAVIERIRVSAFVVLAVFLGSVAWILAASWGWHPDGWLVKNWGYHDVGCAGLIHVVAGFFALGVLLNLGPRIGKYNADGTANDLLPHNVPMVLIGLMLIIVGFFGFLGACLIFNPGAQWTNINAFGLCLQYADVFLRRHHRCLGNAARSILDDVGCSGRYIRRGRRPRRLVPATGLPAGHARRRHHQARQRLPRSHGYR